MTTIKFTALLLCAAATLTASADALTFTKGRLVVAVEGNGVVGGTGTYADNAAAPLSLFEYSHTGTTSAAYTGKLVLPQTTIGKNSAISGEYGSSSEALLQRSADGKSLVIAGYGVNAAAFNANPTAYGTAVNDPSKPTALGQSGSLKGAGYTPVARVVARIGTNGSVDTTTALYGVFNGNNPRSVATVDGKSYYISGQGRSGDATGGVFYATGGASSATAITGLDTNSKTQAQDTRDVQVVGGQLYVSVDSKSGSGNNRDFVGTLGTAGALPTTLANGGNGPTKLAGFGNSGGTGKLTLTAQTSNGVNAVGKEINLSPESYFFATSSIMYVTDTGQPKNNSAATSLGDGGLQKWVKDGSGNWNLAYTLFAGLNLVANTAASGTTGLFGLAGEVDGSLVNLYATNYIIGDLGATYIYGITDVLSATTRPTGAATETFVKLATAPDNSKFQGIALAPVPEPASWALMITGFAFVGVSARRRGTAVAA
ncbi:PEPxxWA-CTERM sorting domain-containing protein [Polymorphobacter sp. PAMC 29334]|uniref:PEPxxWA-CTERM sorting domain-containing protein n=1 Tax=Polymorphobacter sp. PAMC 29334 TaxID=2862331 RepID=UPI001C751948|nr:PEPxxWA-CTERM sorting domain-containing protein [Polymorphobacter sp. PAMC 29334]QYE35461.1 PEPxxWA-CTERM sorting domain-containing protein [Polymorphobacter sp. PAMC 29334]